MKVPLVKHVRAKVARITISQLWTKVLKRPQGQRELQMNILKFGFAAVTLAALVACGGQGSSLPPQVPQDTPKGAWNIASKDYTVQEGQSVARATINWSSTASSTGVTVRDAAGKVYATGPSGPATIDVPVGTIQLWLVNGDGRIISEPITLSSACVGGTSVNSLGICTSTVVEVLHYADKVVGLWTDHYPYMMTRTGATKVENMTQWNGLGKDLFNCLISVHPLADGKIPALCKDLAELKYRQLYVNPMTVKLYEYVGTLPADLHYSVNPDGSLSPVDFGVAWKSSQEFDPNTPNWGAKAKVADGWYFTPANETWVLKFQDNANTVSTIKAGTFEKDGSIFLMTSYSN